MCRGLTWKVRTSGTTSPSATLLLAAAGGGWCHEIAKRALELRAALRSGRRRWSSERRGLRGRLRPPSWTTCDPRPCGLFLPATGSRAACARLKAGSRGLGPKSGLCGNLRAGKKAVGEVYACGAKGIYGKKVSAAGKIPETNTDVEGQSVNLQYHPLPPGAQTLTVLLNIPQVKPYFICEIDQASGILRPIGCAAYLTKTVRTGVPARTPFEWADCSG